MLRPVHFEFAVSDPGRASKFWKDVFGWKIEKWDGPEDYWLVTTGEKGADGIDGGLMRRREEGEQTVINTITVDSVDDYVKKITDAGGEIAVPKMAISGVGWFCYFKDTEGIMSGIMQPDANAK
ncbi:MAG: VOC family protein [candidate division Zixibacteria bacterium]|nr:VOC family protein [candidate division Zixibacteria bacterium]